MIDLYVLCTAYFLERTKSAHDIAEIRRKTRCDLVTRIHQMEATVDEERDDTVVINLKAVYYLRDTGEGEVKDLKRERE